MIKGSKIRWMGVAMAALAVAGCASGPTRPQMSAFDPEALAYDRTGDGQPEIDYSAYVAGRFAGANKNPLAADYLLAALAQDPDNMVIIDQAFSLLVLEGRFEDAAVLAEQQWNEDRANNLSRLTLAVRAFRKGRLAEARAYLDSLADSGFQALIRPVLSAWVYAEEGEIDTALKALGPLLGTRGLAGFGQVNQAYILDYAGRTEDAAQVYERVLESGQFLSYDPIMAYASMLARTGDRDRALDLMDTYLQVFNENNLLRAHRERLAQGQGTKSPFSRDPKASVAFVLQRAASELSSQQANRAAILYARLATYLYPGYDEAWLLLSGLLSNEDRHTAAISAVKEIPSDSFIHDAAVMQLATAYWRAERADEAIEVLQGYLADNPRNLRAATFLGDIFRVQGDFGRSIETYDLALAGVETETQEHYALYFYRGIAHEQQNEWPEAEADLLRALELNPDDPELLNYLGYSWIDRGVNLERGLELIRKAVDQRPNNGMIIDSLGWAHYLLEDYERATQLLERATALEPSDPTINDHLGDAYWQVGRRLEARFQWQHALANDPEEKLKLALQDKLALGLTVASRALEQ